MENIQEKVVMITGASSGIGKETALALAKEGAKLVLCARDEKALKEVAKQIGFDNCVYLKSDVTNREELTELVNLALNRFGKIDVLFANAGIMPVSSAQELKVDEWNMQIDVNIKGVLYSIAAVLPTFIKNNYGHIIVTSSMAGIKYIPGNAVYCGTKHFVKAYINSLRAEAINEGYNLKTTLIYPGAIRTNLLSTITNENIKGFVQNLYDNNQIEPKAVSDAVLYAISQPNDVDIADITIRPKKEA